MTTVYQIIVDAYRQSNLVTIGVAPTVLQEVEGLRYLQRIVKGVLGFDAGESLLTFPLGRSNISRPSGWPGWDETVDGEWVVPKNTRLVMNIDTATALYLDPCPNDGERFGIIDAGNTFNTYNVTVYGNGRRIETSLSKVLSTNGQNSEWLYRADTANWQKYTDLELFDTFPFPEEFDDYFILLLAFRLNPAYERELDPQSQTHLQRMKTMFKARYQQKVETRPEEALVRLPQIDANRVTWVTTNDTEFNSGRIY